MTHIAEYFASTRINQMIAQFMGYKREAFTLNSERFGYFIPVCHIYPWKDLGDGATLIDENELLYDRTFDWLMPVVERLHEMGHRIVLHEDGYVEAWVFDDEGFCDGEEAFANKALLDNMYEAVVYMVTKLVTVK